ncbi:hypothetical protein B0H66DRAFT_615829 [Apodospora peruviana]|uniref:Methyltransferase type 11 domain-containing protein n=1 Tax=Apodospora peruviana TaxID=516989 RepID=A0AAE0IHT4_9PEZI|nr:hypothetical protein B0H66DRAFT_615829 [Apodospora peruviana]
MFDVDWHDYTTEKVGERQARKKELRKNKDSSPAHDRSLARSSSSSGDRHFGILESIGIRRSSASTKGKKPVSLALAPPKEGAGKPQRSSAFVSPTYKIASNESSLISNDGVSLNSAPTSGGHGQGIKRRLQGLGRAISDRLSQEPEPLKSPDNSVPPLTPSRSSSIRTSAEPLIPETNVDYFQSIGSDSYVTRTTEMAYEERTESDIDTVLTITKIWADYREPQTPKSPSPPSSPTSPGKDTSVSLLIDEWFTAVHTPSNSSSSPKCDEPLRRMTISQPSYYPSSRSPLSPKDTPTRSPRQRTFPTTPLPRSTRLAFDNPDAWKPPDAWHCSPTPEETALTTDYHAAEKNTTTTTDLISVDLEVMKNEIKKMAAACPQSILVKLNEEWGTVADPGFYKEVEMSRKRWMLSALDYLKDTNESPEQDSHPSSKDEKVLALFESQSTASYLAAFYSDGEITHLSPSPLSHILFPNIQPIVSTITPAVTLAPNLFTSVHCLALPSLVPSHEILPLLWSIHRCLASSGVLHLNLIDPAPVAKSLGPCMRQWLEQNLMLNLGKQFRCTNPCKLIPEWLGEAHLRAPGSQVSRVKFQAVYLPGSPPSNVIKIDQGRSELLTTVGRLLWKEVWGKFVHGNVWWWDDADCVKECLRLGTYWEYLKIGTIKEDIPYV